MAVIVAALRVLYDKKESKLGRVAVEALLCGAIAYMAIPLASWIGMPVETHVPIGGAVGFLGVEFWRAMVTKVVSRFVEKKIDVSGSDPQV